MIHDVRRKVAIIMIHHLKRGLFLSGRIRDRIRDSYSLLGLEMAHNRLISDGVFGFTRVQPKTKSKKVMDPILQITGALATLGVLI